MSLLTLVQGSMRLCGLAPPSIAFASTDDTVQEFIAWAQVEGDELRGYSDWRQLKVLVTLTGDGSSTTYSLPADFDRWLVGSQFYIDGDAGAPLLKVSDDEMLAAKARAVSPTRPVWRMFGDSVEFYPAPSAGEVIKSEYRSQYWIINSTLTDRQISFEADTDFPLLPLAVMKLGMAWRWRMSKGMDYAELYRMHQVERTRAANNEQGKQTIHIRGSGRPEMRGDPVVSV